MLVVALICNYITAVVSIKRFHDLGYTGFMVFTIAIPIVKLFAFVILGLFKGVPKENIYGPSTIQGLPATNTPHKTVGDIYNK